MYRWVVLLVRQSGLVAVIPRLSALAESPFLRYAVVKSSLPLQVGELHHAKCRNLALFPGVSVLRRDNAIYQHSAFYSPLGCRPTVTATHDIAVIKEPFDKCFLRRKPQELRNITERFFLASLLHIPSVSFPRIGGRLHLLSPCSFPQSALLDLPQSARLPHKFSVHCSRLSF